jgi:dephospho-CoA kinase
MPFPDEFVDGVIVVPYDQRWPREFDELGARLVAALGPLAYGVDHIGSTSVPGLAAKDCLDVQVRVDRLDEAAVAGAVTAVGLRRRLEPWNQVEVDGGQRWPKIVFAPPVGERASNVHVREVNAATTRRNLLFRDFLRADAAARDAWGAFKSRLALSVRDLADYGQIKQPATEVLMHAAKNWAGQTGWAPPPPDWFGVS